MPTTLAQTLTDLDAVVFYLRTQDSAGLALEQQGLFSSSRLGEEDGEHGGIGADEGEEDEEDPDSLVELLAKLARDVRAVLLLGGLM